MDLALACAKSHVYLIHISTDYVFDGLKKQEYIESDNCNPINIYGKGKFLGEELVKRFTNDYIILRVSWVFSAYGKNFLKTIIQKSKSESELRIVCDQFGGPTPTALIVKCLNQIICLLSKNNIETGTYNISGQPHVSWYEFAKNIISEAKRHKLIKKNIRIIPIEAIHFKSNANRPNNSRLSVNKIRKVLPNIDFNYFNYLDDIMTTLSKDKSF
jgi:dTDP-4-dehydrorhamnose reductase